MPAKAQRVEFDLASAKFTGDFNVSPEVGDLVDKNGLVDVWVALHGRADPDGATWGVGVEQRDGLGPRRLDKVAWA